MTETFTDLVYSDDRKGALKLYIFEPSGYHRGGVWFERKPRYPEEGEITTAEAEARFHHAMAERREIRICNGGDMLVLHAKDGRMIHPQTSVDFWSSLP